MYPVKWRNVYRKQGLSCVSNIGLTVFVFAVVIVHNTLVAEGLRFFALFACTNRVQLDTCAVVHTSLLACTFSLQLLKIRLIRATGYSRKYRNWKNQLGLSWKHVSFLQSIIKYFQKFKTVEHLYVFISSYESKWIDK